VIDGATNSITSVFAGNGAIAVAVNPVTNKIYVAVRVFCETCGSGSVTVIDGATNSTTTVTDPNAVGPLAVAVNPPTNKIYVGNPGSGSVTVIDGASNSTTTINDPGAISLAVNAVTNKIYVANDDTGHVTVIDGPTNSITTITDPNARNPSAVAVNPATNKSYVANPISDNVTVIGGASGIPLSSFSGKLELNLGAGSFDLNADFTLGPGGSINPATQPLTLTIGTYSVTIPAGSFVRHKPGYAFEGVINGVSLEVLIKFGSTPASYMLLAQGRGANLTGTVNSVSVTLSIGDNTGITQINAEFQ